MKKEHTTLVVALVAAAFTATGCETAPVASELDPTPATAQATVGLSQGEVRPMGRIDAPDDSPLHDPQHPGHMDAAQALFREAMPVQLRAQRVLNSGATLEQKEAAVRAAFHAPLSREARWLVQTSLGPDILALHLAAPAPDARAIAYYTRRLASYGNPNAPLLERGASVAASVMAPSDVQQLRRQIVQAGQRYSQGRTCRACQSAELTEEQRANLVRKNAEIAAATR